VSSSIYSLAGFSTGGAIPPQFAVPIFEKDGDLYVQHIENGKITAFRIFTDKIDIIDDGNEKKSFNDNALFCVIEEGERLIFGEKAYVARYLDQNLKNYVEFPFFLKDVYKFLGKSIEKDLPFIKNRRDVIEYSSAVASIKEFLHFRYAESKKLGDPSQKYLIAYTGNSDGVSTEIFSDFENYCIAKDKKIAKRGSWVNLSRSTIFNSDKISRVSCHLIDDLELDSLKKLRSNEDVFPNFMHRWRMPESGVSENKSTLMRALLFDEFFKSDREEVAENDAQEKFKELAISLIFLKVCFRISLKIKEAELEISPPEEDRKNLT